MRQITSIITLLCSLIIPQTGHAQISGPIQATIGDSQVKMEYGNNANAPTADEVVIYRGDYQHNGDEWINTQWSWVLWWEANKHRYLKQAGSANPQTMTAPVVQRALIKTLNESQHINTLSAAILALGRMQARDAVPVIEPMLKHDSEYLQRAAWLSLALISDPPSIEIYKKTLIDKNARNTVKQAKNESPTLNPQNASAWIIGIGLLKQSDPQLLQTVSLFVLNDQESITDLTGLKLDDQEALQLARLAMWAIRMHNPPGTRALAQRVLTMTVDPELYDQAVLAMADNATEDLVLNVLTPIYHSRPVQYRQVPKALSFVMNQWPGSPVLDQDIASMRTSAAVAYANKTFKNDLRLALLAKRNVARTYRSVPLPKLTSRENRRDRESDHRQPENRLFKFDPWLNHAHDYDLPKQDDVGYALRFGLIALGQLGDLDMDDHETPEDAQLLCDILIGTYPRIAVTQLSPNPAEKVNWQNDPSRGFAALAMGLYLRRLPNNAGEIRHDAMRSQTRYMLRLLTRIASDPTEPSDIRSSCVLGLGLSNMQEASTSLRDVVSQMQSADPLLASYLTLAMGMLGDPMSLQLAKNAFKQTAENIDEAQIRKTGFTQSYTTVALLSQTAIVDGMGCMANPQANQLLYPRLFEDPMTARSMIGAIKNSGDWQVTGSLIALLQNPGSDPQVGPFAAWALGEMYDQNPVPIMTERLLRDRNLTLLLLQPKIKAQSNTCACSAKVKDSKPVRAHSLTQLYLQEINPLLFKQIIKFPRG